ncbi:3-phosphoshikimate 1-carboxyvinyltransferase [Enterococcus sp.]|uniref:3-phosphoshikimate 1-carboxyvinyltransferase n=1 Tax=Enterococcus sp. TaxID=35783 RepID=UPI002FCC060C
MKLISKSPLKGIIEVPADKSISHRSIMFGSIAHGTTTIKNFLRGEDCFSTMHAFQALGVAIEDDGDVITVHGKGIEGLRAPNQALDVGNSGTTIRLMMGMLNTCPFETVLYGDESLSLRPMNRVILPLQSMGAKISGHAGTEFPPITIHGSSQLQPMTYEMPVASAQVKSAILFAALQTEGLTTIIEKEASRNHTEEMILQFGGQIQQDGKEIRLTGPQQLQGQAVTVPGDISSAAFFLAAGAIVPESEITLKNVGINPTRTGILKVLEEMGATLSMTNIDEKNQSADISIQTSQLKGITIGGEIIPTLIDELPVIALLATQAEGTTVIKDAEELKVKETNRIDATCDELKKLGANIEATADGLIIHGPTTLHGGSVSSLGDHRIGMMLQVAALLTDETVTLENPESIAISYPSFFEDVEQLTTK